MSGPLPVATDTLHLGEFGPPLLVSATYLALYGTRARTLARQGRPPSPWRVACFVAGVLLVALVQLPPLDGLADEVLIAHMAQHIVLGDVATLLIVLGLTGPLLQPLLQLRFTRPLRRLAFPVIALVLWTVDIYVWHLPLLYQLAVQHDLVHALEHACLVWFGVLLWLALIGPLPKPAWFDGWGQLGYVAGVRFAGAVLANVLIWGQTIYYPVYAASDAARGLNPLSDQNAAGAIMMVEQIVLTGVLLAWLFLRAARRDEERQELLDLAFERGVPLSERRAAIAARSGSSERLREQLLGRGSPSGEPEKSARAPRSEPGGRGG